MVIAILFLRGLPKARILIEIISWLLFALSAIASIILASAFDLMSAGLPLIILFTLIYFIPSVAPFLIMAIFVRKPAVRNYFGA